METTGQIINTEAEVKKLKDLVKKLEQQNEILLKSKQQVSENNPSEQSKNNINSNDRINNFSLDDVELLNIDDDTLGSQEDDWLYESPTKPSPAQKTLSPYKWVRTDIEDNNKRGLTSHGSLSQKLDEVAKVAFQWSPFNSHGKLPNSKITPLVKNATIPGKINTNTFTRPKKSLTPDLVGNGDQKIRPSTNLSEGHRNVSEIQAMAKMQEEALRRACSPTSRISKNNSGVPPIHLSDGEVSSPQSSTRSSPGRNEEGFARRYSSTNSQHRHSFSSGSSPPDSPFGSNQYLDAQQKTSAGYSSSNLTKSNLSSQRSPVNENNGQPMTYRVMQPKVASPNTLQKPSQRVRSLRQPSPVRRPASAGIPTPSSKSDTGIPRPGSAGKNIHIPRRSGIPTNVQRSGNYAASSGSDDSWKEGCY